MQATMGRLRFLLDTNILSHLVRHSQGIVRDRIAEVGENAVCSSLLVAAELRFGAAEKGSVRLTRQVDAVLAALPIVFIEAPMDVHYAEIRAGFVAEFVVPSPSGHSLTRLSTVAVPSPKHPALSHRHKHSVTP